MSNPSHTYTSFAVAGGLNAGAIGASLGGFHARALIKEGVHVKVLGRRSAMDGHRRCQRARRVEVVEVVEVDYESPLSLASALRGVEVVISTLAGPGFAAQPALADADKAEGVKLFVLSELTPEISLFFKTAFQAKLKEIGMPSLLLFNGPFADWCKEKYISVNDQDEIVIVGMGKSDITFTAREDVSRFLAHLLTHLPASRLVNSTFTIEGSRTTFRDLAHKIQVQRPDAKIVHESHATALARFKADSAQFFSWLKVEWDEGHGTVITHREEVNNGAWVEWNPRPVEDFLF